MWALEAGSLAGALALPLTSWVTEGRSLQTPEPQALTCEKDGVAWAAEVLWDLLGHRLLVLL